MHFLTFKLQMPVLDSLFGSKLGFKQILDSLLAVFTRSVTSYNSAESKLIWMISGALGEYVVGGWPWQILSAIRAVSDSWRARQIFFVR